MPGPNGSLFLFALCFQGSHFRSLFLVFTVNWGRLWISPSSLRGILPKDWQMYKALPSGIYPFPSVCISPGHTRIDPEMSGMLWNTEGYWENYCTKYALITPVQTGVWAVMAGHKKQCCCSRRPEWTRESYCHGSRWDHIPVTFLDEAMQVLGSLMACFLIHFWRRTLCLADCFRQKKIWDCTRRENQENRANCVCSDSTCRKPTACGGVSDMMGPGLSQVELKIAIAVGALSRECAGLRG